MKIRPIRPSTIDRRPSTVAADLAARATRKLYDYRTKLATVAVAVLAVLLAMHVIFGDNGMVVYQKKRAEFRSLQKEVDQIQQENQAISGRINALKTDPKAIEKEAREQLHYARPGEVIYLAPPTASAPPPNASAKK